MFCCLCGEGDLRALAFDFSPKVEQSGPPSSHGSTVTFDASGLDRLFGLPQDVAAAVARRAKEMGAKTRIAIASNPDAAICAARAFAGVSIVPYGDEGKFLGELPVTVLSPSPELAETLARWGIRRLRELGRCRRWGSLSGWARRAALARTGARRSVAQAAVGGRRAALRGGD